MPGAARLRPSTRKEPRTVVRRSLKRADLLSSVLASGALARLVTHLGVRPDEAPHARALQRNTGLTPRSLQIELARLGRLGVVERRQLGRRVAYALKEGTPRWRLLRQLVQELADPVDVVQDALADIPGIAAAFVFGSFARGDVREDSDIDVFILSDILPGDLMDRRTLEIGVLLRREVNVVAMTRNELGERRAAGSSFLRHILAGPKRWVVGTEHAIADETPVAVGATA